MLSIKKTLGTILQKMNGISKKFQTFLIELFETIPAIQGRVNFTNLSRYSRMHEQSFRRNFGKVFDWLRFNILFLEMVCLGVKKTRKRIGAMDCSFIKKSGQQTYGLDKYWSGTAQKAEKGLEVSLLCVIDTESKEAWTVQARQTPAGLSAEEGEEKVYTRVDFYMKQFKENSAQLPDIEYYVMDGFYAKSKVITSVKQANKYLISKLRCDADLKYLLDWNKNRSAHGNKTYEGKVRWKSLELAKWNCEGLDEEHPNYRVYSCKLFAVRFKQILNVVLILNTKTNNYVLLFSTDLQQSGLEVLSYYRLRFQIEFIFRDAKQFTGLEHSQSRSKEKLDFHFNTSFSSLNLYRFLSKSNKQQLSMNSFVRKEYNTKLVKLVFEQLSSKPEFSGNFDLGCLVAQNAINFGLIQQSFT